MSTSKGKTVTIKTIAESLGISFSTVSKALNDDPNIKKETRERVRARADELGYEPNYMAKSLRAESTNTIGIIVNDVENPAIAFILKRISVQMARKDYSTLICDSQYDRDVEERNIRSVLSRKPDSLIIFPVSSLEGRQDIFGNYRDKVIVLGDSRNRSLSSVSVDYGYGGYLSAKQLLENGHRDFLVFAEPSSFPISNDYIDGIRRCCAEYGVDLPDERVFHSEPSIDNGFRLFMSLWDEEKKQFRLPFTGILCFCDTLAHGAYRGCNSLGLSIPDDVSIIGFDDNPLSAYSDPPLTTIYLPKEKMLESCLEILDSKLTSRDSATERYFIQPYLVSRKSVKNRKEK